MEGLPTGCTSDWGCDLQADDRSRCRGTRSAAGTAAGAYRGFAADYTSPPELRAGPVLWPRTTRGPRAKTHRAPANWLTKPAPFGSRSRTANTRTHPTPTRAATPSPCSTGPISGLPCTPRYSRGGRTQPAPLEQCGLPLRTSTFAPATSYLPYWPQHSDHQASQAGTLAYAMLYIFLTFVGKRHISRMRPLLALCRYQPSQY